MQRCHLYIAITPAILIRYIMELGCSPMSGLHPDFLFGSTLELVVAVRTRSRNFLSPEVRIGP
jgi:hypothetical protein